MQVNWKKKYLHSCENKVCLISYKFQSSRKPNCNGENCIFYKCVRLFHWSFWKFEHWHFFCNTTCIGWSSYCTFPISIYTSVSFQLVTCWFWSEHCFHSPVCHIWTCEMDRRLSLRVTTSLYPFEGKIYCFIWHWPRWVKKGRT